MKDPMKYGKAKGVMLLQKYLPKLSPFKSINIVSNIEEWNEIKDNFEEGVANRVDYPIGKSRKNAVAGNNDLASGIPDLIKKVNNQSSDGVVLLLPTKEGAVIPLRYEVEGGFNVLFNKDTNVIIELVGKGFDSHEITQGLANHERYVIPWNDVLFIRNRKDMIKNPNVQKSHVKPHDYEKQRLERIKFLHEIIGYDLDKIEENVPKTYTLVSDDVIRNLLDDVILELMEKMPSLSLDGLTQFGVQGNIVEGKLQPWEIFRNERWITKDTEVENER